MILAAPATTNRRLRVAIYARHSSDKQSVTSSADQAAACEELVARLCGEVVSVYTDPEISGYRRDRPGLLAMLDEVRTGTIDMIVCEALDRIARDGEDISWLGKKLSYHRVRLFTHTEGEIDEIKLAVAGLLGSMFLSNLRTKTFRGVKAAVLAGRLGGGKAYGYRKVAKTDADGRVVNGVFEIDPEQAEVVRRIHRDFAAGRSSIQIATALNAERIPGPRGGEWNASTIRGDPSKLVGILNNPLYRGRLVWGRREWRKNPDSDRRERRYRLRDEGEWIEVNMPDLRIVDEELAAAVAAEIAGRRRAPGERTTGAAKRAKHLLSGLIRCGSCGANHTLVGKDYYRCARNRERGTCQNGTTVRARVVEDAALAALQTRLLTPDLVRVFTEEFNREVERLTRTRGESDRAARDRLAELDVEIGNLAANFLTGTVSPTLSRMLSEREAEKTRIKRQLDTPVPTDPKVVAHPALVRRYEQKVANLREALNDEVLKSDAIVALRTLIGSVTVNLDEQGGTVIDVEASTATLIDFAATTNAPQHGAAGRSGMVVAGTGFEPVTFRL